MILVIQRIAVCSAVEEDLKERQENYKQQQYTPSPHLYLPAIASCHLLQIRLCPRRGHQRGNTRPWVSLLAEESAVLLCSDQLLSSEKAWERNYPQDQFIHTFTINRDKPASFYPCHCLLHLWLRGNVMVFLAQCK